VTTRSASSCPWTPCAMARAVLRGSANALKRSVDDDPDSGRRRRSASAVLRAPLTRVGLARRRTPQTPVMNRARLRQVPLRSQEPGPPRARPEGNAPGRRGRPSKYLTYQTAHQPFPGQGPARRRISAPVPSTGWRAARVRARWNTYRASLIPPAARRAPSAAAGQLHSHLVLRHIQVRQMQPAALRQRSTG